MSDEKTAVEEKVDGADVEELKKMASAGEPLIKLPKPPANLGPHVEPKKEDPVVRIIPENATPPPTKLPPGEEFEPPPTQAGMTRLTELEMSKVDAHEWKLKAHSGRMQMADNVADKCRDEYNEAVTEFHDYCKSIGLDPERTFAVAKDGTVEYEKPQEPKEPERYKRVN